MISEIKKEIIYIFWICAILAWGCMICSFDNQRTLWEIEYENWTYNLNPQEGNVWIDSIVKPK